MNNKKIISRIIIDKDGKLHIALDNHKIVAGSSKSILNLLASPYKFIETDYKQYTETTRDINNYYVCLMDIPGMTMVQIYDDATITVFQPSLFSKLYEHNHELSVEQLDFKDYLFRTEFADQKEFLMKFYLDASSQPMSELTIEKKLSISSELQESLMREIINSQFNTISTRDDLTTIEEDITVFSSNMEHITPFNNNNKKYKKGLTVTKYAEHVGKPISTIRNWIKTNKIAFFKDEATLRIYISPDEPIPMDGRKNPRKREPTPSIKLDNDSYDNVQEFISKNKIVTDNIRKFIRTSGEAKYYKKNHYHEVSWSSRNALIIDVNLDYRCPQLDNKTNRQLILEGHSPVVPGDNLEYFHLHHIGQREDSPFAIIPASVHNGSTYSKYFHVGSGVNELHTPEFEIEKKVFWKEYVTQCDKYSGYRFVPFLNSIHKKD